MDELTEQINRILAKWDPINVGVNLALDEYKGYIPMIVHYIQNRQQLMKYLEEILIDDMGLAYDHSNRIQNEDLQKICDDLIQIYQNYHK